jgi:hypothetical protein
MPNISFPLPDFRVAHYYDNWLSNEDTEVDVTFQLLFGRYKVVEKSYTVPRLDYDDIHFDDARDEFDKYVAERLERLFS